MAEPARRRVRLRRPARPLFGYRDLGAPDQRHDRRAVIRAWLILAVMITIYLAIALTVYFVEPGLR
jgi:hypothetical protein